MKLTLSLIVVLFSSFYLFGQGPGLDYFYHAKTVLSWGNCEIYYQNGGRQKLGFFPVINEMRNAPFGANGYTARITLDNPVAFMGTGEKIIHCNDKNRLVIWQNKIVAFYYEADDTAKVNDISKIIEKLIQNRAAGALLLSNRDVPPMVYTSMDTELPVISLNGESTRQLFHAAGYTIQDGKEKDISAQKTVLEILTLNMKLEIKSNFEKHTRTYCDYLFMPELFADSTIDKTIGENEQSITFIIDLFSELKHNWKKEKIHYFGNYDSKVFYTGYWGKGFSDASGVYNILFSGNENYALSVHENTHSLLNSSLGPTSSFINEGVAMFAQDKALKSNTNHINTLNYLKKGKIYPLKQLLLVEIGKKKTESEMAYAAAGSFIGFLLKNYGWDSLEKIWKSKQLNALDKSVESIETEWLDWLKENYDN